jgi:hypothetical protein
MPRADGLDFSGSSGGRRNWVLLALVIVAALAAFTLFFGRSTPVGQSAGMAPGGGAASGSASATGSAPVAGPASANSQSGESSAGSLNPLPGSSAVQGDSQNVAPSSSSPTGPTVIEVVPAQNLR